MRQNVKRYCHQVIYLETSKFLFCSVQLVFDFYQQLNLLCNQLKKPLEIAFSSRVFDKLCRQRKLVDFDFLFKLSNSNAFVWLLK